MRHIDVLIIDDEKKFATMLAKRIGLRGCHTHICYDGKSALQWVEKHVDCVSLILLDLQLPDMYGTKVLARIKSISSTIPVVVLTGHGTEKDKKECEQIGAYKFMHKPLDINELMTILGRVSEVSK